MSVYIGWLTVWNTIKFVLRILYGFPSQMNENMMFTNSKLTTDSD